MKHLLTILILTISLNSCTDSPVGNPEATTAQANIDQAKALNEIAIQLKRIADAMEIKTTAGLMEDTINYEFHFGNSDGFLIQPGESVKMSTQIK